MCILWEDKTIKKFFTQFLLTRKTNIQHGRTPLAVGLQVGCDKGEAAPTAKPSEVWLTCASPAEGRRSPQGLRPGAPHSPNLKLSDCCEEESGACPPHILRPLHQHHLQITEEKKVSCQDQKRHQRILKLK